MKIIDWLIGHTYYLPILMHNWICRRRQLMPMYEALNTNRKKGVGGRGKKTVILMVKNETTFCGGLSDRLRGITSVYEECKKQGLDFFVCFETPHLEDYLEPNVYDWRISEDEIIYDSRRVYPCTILSHHPISDRRQPKVQLRILRLFLKKNYEQIHVYTNMYSGDEHFSELFHELFKPHKELQDIIDKHVAALGGAGNYEAIVFRFRQLLGDLKEGGDVLPQDEREPYIQKCLKTVERLHEEHPEERLLVTSDSNTFLESVAHLSYVYVIPGCIVHMGFTYDANRSAHMKSFADYFVLSHARRITMACDNLLFNSGFPLRAAMLNGAEYNEMFIEER